jgi:hypothetical protein
MSISEKAAELTKLREELGQLEFDVVTSYTLADAIREGCQVSEQAAGWGDGPTACAMTAAIIASKSRGFM